LAPAVVAVAAAADDDDESDAGGSPPPSAAAAASSAMARAAYDDDASGPGLIPRVENILANELPRRMAGEGGALPPDPAVAAASPHPPPSPPSWIDAPSIVQFDAVAASPPRWREDAPPPRDCCCSIPRSAASQWRYGARLRRG